MTSFAYQDLADAVAAGLSEIPNAAVSREAAVSGIYGGVTSLLGMPAINPNVNWSQRIQGESWLNYAKRLNPVSWNSIFTLPFSDASIAEENKQRQAIADYVSLFLSDPSKQKLFENEKSAVIGFEFKVREKLTITPNFKMTISENALQPNNFIAYLNCTYNF
jgi:hypothetical protein